MDIIYIEGLKIQTVIGVLAWERAIQQTIVLDLELATDSQKAAWNDSIDEAIDYQAVTDEVKLCVEQSGFNLIETLAEHVANRIQERFGVRWLRLKVSKPGAVKGTKNIALRIERGEKQE